MIQYPQYVQEGRLTPDGEKVKAFIEGLFVEADKANDTSKLNGLSGYASYYYVNVFKGGGKGFGMPAVQWFGEMTTMANAAWRDLRYFEEQAAEKAAQEAKVEEATQTTSALASAIEELKTRLGEHAAKLVVLEAENATLRKAVKRGKGKDADETADAPAEPPADEAKADEA